MTPAEHNTISRQSSRIVYRFVWKELRQLRPLALGVGCIALLLVALGRLTLAPPDLWMAVPIVLGGSVVVVALAGSVMLYSVETEERTKKWLQVLPQNWSAIFFGKTLAVVLTTLLFAAVTLPIAFWQTSAAYAAHDWSMFLNQVAVFSIEAVVWGIFWSLVCPWPLVAGVLACAAVSLHASVAIALSSTGVPTFSIEAYQSAISYRLLLAAVVMAMNVWLARDWLITGQSPRALKRRRGGGESRATDTASSLSRGAPHGDAKRERRTIADTNWVVVGRRSSAAAFSRLVWQTVRTSLLPMLLVTLAGCGLTAGMILLSHAVTGQGFNNPQPYPSLMWLFFVPALCGAYTFVLDQQQRSYRYLAEHVASPRMVWLARNVCWGLPIAMLAALCVVGGSWLVTALEHWDSEDYVSQYVPWQMAYAIDARERLLEVDIVRYVCINAAGGILASFALGQFLSLAIRSQVLAAGAALLTSVVVAHWCGLIGLWRLPLAWCLLPLIVGPIVASYLRVGDWLIDRHRTWRWLACASVIVVPIAIVLASIPSIRMRQIEWAQQVTATLVAHSATNSGTPDPQVGNHNGLSLDQLEAVYESQMSYAVATAQAYQAALDKLGEPRWLDDSGHFYEHLLTHAVREHPAVLEDIIELTQFPTAAYSLNPFVKSMDDFRAEWPGQAMAVLASGMSIAIDNRNGELVGKCYLAHRRLLWQMQSSQIINHPIDNVLVSFLRDLHFDENLVEWAIAPQTPIQDIEPVLDEFVKLDELMTENSLLMSVMATRQHAQQLMRASPQERADNANAGETNNSIALLLHHLPGEHERAVASVDVWALATAEYFASTVRQTLNASQARTLRAQLRLLPANARLADLPPLAVGVDVHATALLSLLEAIEQAKSSRVGGVTWPSLQLVQTRIRTTYARRVRDRLVALRLALIIYHRKHGAYPDNLRSLAESALNVAVDPYGGGELLGYSKSGFEFPVSHDQSPANTPYIWSIGPGNVRPVTSKVSRTKPGADPSDDDSSELVDEIIFQPTEDTDYTLYSLALPKDSDYHAPTIPIDAARD